MNRGITRVIDNYIIRYQSIMKFMYKEPIDKVNERLGVKDIYTGVKKRKKPDNYTADSLIKLLYFGAYIGMNGENTMIMHMNIDEQPCTLTFKIENPKSTPGKDNNE